MPNGTAASVIYYHFDGLGSVIAATSGGAVTASYGYGPFGETPSAAGAAFRFAGYRIDPETGLYYVHARTYSPALGRFLSPDPIGYQGGNNLYAYVGNDPLNLTDPTGLCASSLCGALNNAYNLLLRDSVNDISQLIQNPSQIPGAVASVAPAIAPAAAELPQAISGAIGLIRVFGTTSTNIQGNPFGIPDHFTAQPSQKGRGTVYIDPTNSYNRVRIMPGNPNSPNSAQQIPYVVDLRNGQEIDVNGNRLSNTSDTSTHIPQSQYQYSP